MSSSDYLKLYRIVKDGDVNGLQTFLTASDQLQVNLNDENTSTHLTPLMAACTRPSSNLKMIDLLIENGAEVDYQTHTDDRGYSALMKAVEVGNVEVVKCLIKHGAQVDLKDNFRGKSALEVGCEKGNVEVVKVLVLLEVEGVQGLSSGDMQHSVSHLHSAFESAVTFNHTKLVKWFLESGKVTDIPDGALFTAIIHQSSEMAQLLLNHGGQLNLQNGREKSALILAASHGDVEVVKKLLERGIDVNMKGEGGSTALLSVLLAEDHVVPQQSKIAIVELLLEYGANVDVKDDSKFTPLKCAIKSRSAEIVKLLIDKDKDLVYRQDKSERDRYHLLNHAYSSPDVLKLLLAAGADPNKQLQHIPLLEVRDVNIAKILIDYGANVNLQNDQYNNYYPIMIAAKESNYELVELLLENGADIKLQSAKVIGIPSSAEDILQKNPEQTLVSIRTNYGGILPTHLILML